MYSYTEIGYDRKAEIAGPWSKCRIKPVSVKRIVKEVASLQSLGSCHNRKQEHGYD